MRKKTAYMEHVIQYEYDSFIYGAIYHRIINGFPQLFLNKEEYMFATVQFYTQKNWSFAFINPPCQSIFAWRVEGK